MKTIFEIARTLEEKKYLVDSVLDNETEETITIMFPNFQTAEKLLYKLNAYCLMYEHNYFYTSLGLQKNDAEFYNKKFKLNYEEYVQISFTVLKKGSFKRSPEFYLNKFWCYFNKEKQLKEIHNYVSTLLLDYSLSSS